MPATVPTLTDVVAPLDAPPPLPREARVTAQRPGRTPPLPRLRGPARHGLASVAVGALALGALAMGALAIGRLAIGALSVRRAHIGRLQVDELVIGRVRVRAPDPWPRQRGG
jgi:hypothetical protein